MAVSQCRFCNRPLDQTFVDLGISPISNDFLTSEQLNRSEKFYPLHVYVCEHCLLAQLEEFESPDHIFADGDYAYFSSYSDSWLQHAKSYTDLMVSRFGLGPQHQVIEIASNDGYLLQYFVERGIPVLGIEPAANVAKVAEEKGVPTLTQFFGVETAQKLTKSDSQADLLLGNNVLAHVPDLNDFVAGMAIALKPSGVLTMEFPHLLQLIQQNQFDTIYHEHFSYFSLLAVAKIFETHNLTLFDVEELPTHGGSLRIYGKHKANTELAVSQRVESLKTKEVEAGLDQISTYANFSEQVQQLKHQLLSFLIDAKANGKTIVGYGAPAKGNTLLNYCGIRTDFIDYTVDRNPHKQGLWLPGTRIPIFDPEQIRTTQPDYLLILPWNLKTEVMENMSFIREWGGEFITVIPEVTVHS